MTVQFPNPDDDTPIMDAIEEEPEEDSSPKGMRVKIEAQAARIKELEAKADTDAGDFRARSMTQAYAAIGLNPEEGVGKAVNTIYDGEAEGLAAFAETEFQHVYDGPEHPYAEQIMNGQARLDAVTQSAGSISPPSEDALLAQAEARGDYQKTLEIKSDEMARWFRR